MRPHRMFRSLPAPPTACDAQIGRAALSIAAAGELMRRNIADFDDFGAPEYRINYVDRLVSRPQYTAMCSS